MNQEQTLDYALAQGSNAFAVIDEDDTLRHAFGCMIGWAFEAYDGLVANDVPPLFAANVISSLLNAELTAHVIRPAAD